MNLTIAEVAGLPLPAALLEGDEVLARTPEWRGALPGAVAYRVRHTRLVVGGDEAREPVCAQVVQALLDELDAATGDLPHRQALRVAMLAASLRTVAGRDVAASGTSSDTLEHACAGIASRTALQVAILDHDRFAVLAPPVAALVLVQVATNAERHDRAVSIALRAARHAFTVEWEGSRGAARAVAARRRDDRRRWGLGFARIAADSIGAVLHPPTETAGGARSAVLETGVSGLGLPLALVRDGAVRRATRSWDEETGLLPGLGLPSGGRAARCLAAAADDPGAIVHVEGWSARAVTGGTWLAIPPDGSVDRARDVLDGMVHERALWDGVPEPACSRIVARAAILAALLGGELERVPGATWNRRAPAVARSYGLAMAVPEFRGAGAVDPRVALFLAGEYGEALEADGDELRLRVRPERRDDPLLRALPSGGGNSIRLS